MLSIFNSIRPFALVVATALWGTAVWSQSFSFSTLAGNAGYGSADGVGNDARFDFPQGVVADAAGNLYVADTANSTIRRIDSAGLVTTLAGAAGAVGSTDGNASAARFNLPQGLTADATGNLYVADTANNLIRRITPAGLVSTLACITNTTGSNNAARFNLPGAITADTAGNLYLTDTYKHTIRMLVQSGTNWLVTTLAGQPNVSGNSDGTNADAGFFLPSGIAVDSAGKLFVADTGNNLIRKITPSGTNWITTTIASINSPKGIALDGAGNLYVSGSAQNLILKLTQGSTNWIVSTLAGTNGGWGSADGTTTNAQFNFPCGLTIGTNGLLYVADALNSTIRQVTPAGAVSTLAGMAGGTGHADGSTIHALFNAPSGVATDPGRNVYVADSANNVIRRIDGLGQVTSLAGVAINAPGSIDGVGAGASFNFPVSIALDSRTNLYVADCFNNEIRKLTPGGSGWKVTTFAGHANAAYSGLITNYVDVITNVVGSTNIIRPLFFGSPQFTNYSGLVTNINGKTTNRLIVVTNTPFYTNISVIGKTKTTNVVVLATNLFPLTPFSSSRAFYYKSAYINYSGFVTNIHEPLTNVYAVVTNVPSLTVSNIINGKTNGATVSLTAVAFNLPVAPRLLNGPCSEALFYQPAGLAVDSADNLYVADGGTNGVRFISGNSVTSLPGSSGSYLVGTNLVAYHSSSVALDAAGNVYVADAFNNTIRRITPLGAVTTLVGSPGTYGTADGTNGTARFASPVAIAVDARTNLLVADALSHTIRQITPSGANWIVSTVGGFAGFSGSEDGPGTAARFNNPGGIAVDDEGNIYVADTDNNTIRMGASATAGPVFLRILAAGNQAVISWRATAVGYQLESSFNPAGASWNTITNTPVISGTNLVVTNISAAPVVFYRLHRH